MEAQFSPVFHYIKCPSRLRGLPLGVEVLEILARGNWKYERGISRIMTSLRRTLTSIGASLRIP